MEAEYVVDIANEQSQIEVDLARARCLAIHTLRLQKVPVQTELSVVYVDENTISALNKRFRGKDRPTDVLSFSIDPPTPSPNRVQDDLHRSPTREEEDPPLLLGDVVICPAYAAKLDPEDINGELDLLLVHGILHLLGFDHEDDREAEIMETREQEILLSFKGATRS